MTTPGLVISAPASGTGKTTVTLGLLAAFRAAGVRVQPFKCGPDYIDPAFHTAAAGRDSLNLDSFAMAPDRLRALAACEAELILAEGAMGLYDGAARPADPPADPRASGHQSHAAVSGPRTPLRFGEGPGERFAPAGRGATGTGASAEIAAHMGWPVLLVLDASGQAQSAGAMARGFDGFRPGVRVAGVILNRVASPRHEAMLRAGLTEAGIACFGALPRRPDVTLPERHLGLVQAMETGDLPARLASLARLVTDHCDLAAIRAAARPGPRPGPEPDRLPPPGQRIALARDAAFSFAYPHMLADWRAQGAELLPFSPLADQAPDPGADTCWLPGGYPELHAGRLASAHRFLRGLAAFAAGNTVHGECGGYMVLGAGLTDAAGQRHAMAGLLGLETSYAQRKLHLGYRRARLLAPIPGFPAGTGLVGHEFHYSTILTQPDAPLATVTDAAGAAVPETGSRRGQVTGSFFHLIGAA